MQYASQPLDATNAFKMYHSHKNAGICYRPNPKLLYPRSEQRKVLRFHHLLKALAVDGDDGLRGTNLSTVGNNWGSDLLIDAVEAAVGEVVVV